MGIPLSNEIKSLVDRANFAHLSTLMPDGSPHEIAYFWLPGTLSAFLDKAPTYRVFFELAGGAVHGVERSRLEHAIPSGDKKGRNQ